MKNKGIIILGAPASGKSYLEEQLYSYIYDITKKHQFRVNPDFYVEDWDTYIEVKGYETALDRSKWSQFPHTLDIWRKDKIESI